MPRTLLPRCGCDSDDVRQKQSTSLKHQQLHDLHNGRVCSSSRSWIGHGESPGLHEVNSRRSRSSHRAHNNLLITLPTASSTARTVFHTSSACSRRDKSTASVNGTRYVFTRRRDIYTAAPSVRGGGRFPTSVLMALADCSL